MRRGRTFLAARSLLFLVLIPGTVAGLIPWRIVRTSPPQSVELSTRSILAGGLMLFGLAVLLRCVWDFFAAGRGTLAPFDPPRRLVVRGLYRFTRNPMYNGVLALLFGQAWLFQSGALLQYALVVLLMFHVMVVVFEERVLAAQFGATYDEYRRAVPRWGFNVRPFEDSPTGDTRD